MKQITVVVHKDGKRYKAEFDGKGNWRKGNKDVVGAALEAIYDAGPPPSDDETSEPSDPRADPVNDKPPAADPVNDAAVSKPAAPAEAPQPSGAAAPPTSPDDAQPG